MGKNKFKIVEVCKVIVERYLNTLRDIFNQMLSNLESIYGDIDHLEPGIT